MEYMRMMAEKLKNKSEEDKVKDLSGVTKDVPSTDRVNSPLH